MRRRLLDLCCGAGLASWGYWRSFRFSEVVGVDISDFSGVYAFDFVQADFTTLTYDFLLDFDFIHVSPPCQAYSKITPDRSIHPRLIKNAHRLCKASGLPHVIENVEGSSRELSPTVVADGAYFGLKMARRRYFHASGVSGRWLAAGSQKFGSVHHTTNRQHLIDVMGLESFVRGGSLRRMTLDHMIEGIPPVMTWALASAFFPDVLRVG